MTRPNIPHVEAIKRAIRCKQAVLDSRRMSPVIRKEINDDIQLLRETIEFLYQLIDNVTLYHDPATDKRSVY